MLNRILLYLIGCSFVGCVSTQQVTTSAPLYKNRANMEITVDGTTFDWMGVTLLNGPKDIDIVSQAALDLLRTTTCHRDFSIEKVDSVWFCGSCKHYVYHYEPTETEKASVCPMYIQAFSKDSVTDWGYLAFRTTE